MAEGCAFCRLVAGAAASSIVFESDTLVAFMDIDPVTPGHLLVVPRAHLPDLADLTDELASEMFRVARLLAAALRRTELRCDGVNLFYADGEAAFQEVFHAHLHVFPRYADDGFVINANWGTEPDRSVLDAIASEISAVINGGS
jgi:histidine triad (HIT) family protein